MQYWTTPAEPPALTAEELVAAMEAMWRECKRGPRPNLIAVSMTWLNTVFDELHRARFERAVAGAWFRVKRQQEALSWFKHGPWRSASILGPIVLGRERERLEGALMRLRGR